MRKITICILMLLCVTCLCVGIAADALPAFGELTGLNDFLARVNEENPVTAMYFTHGYGFSVAEFSTGDPEKIAAVLDALRNVEIIGTTDMDVTDWYPYLSLRAADGMTVGMSFDGEWLETGRTHYVLNGIKELYGVLNRLTDGTTEERRTLYVNGTAVDLTEISLRDFTDNGLVYELHPEDGTAYVADPEWLNGMTVGITGTDPDAPLTFIDMAFCDDLPVSWCGGDGWSGPEYWENELFGIMYERTYDDDDDDGVIWECADIYVGDRTTIRFETKGDAPALYIDRD